MEKFFHVYHYYVRNKLMRSNFHPYLFTVKTWPLPTCLIPNFHTTSSQFPICFWSNGLASSRKLKTWVYLRLRLARPCVHLRWVAMTCDHFGRDQICTQVNASFLPFGHPTQVSSQVQLAATCESVWPGLYIDLMRTVFKFPVFISFILQGRNHRFRKWHNLHRARVEH